VPRVLFARRRGNTGRDSRARADGHDQRCCLPPPRRRRSASARGARTESSPSKLRSFARRFVRSRRSCERQGSPWTEDPTESEDLEVHREQASDAHVVASRELLSSVLERLRQELSSKMLQLLGCALDRRNPHPYGMPKAGMQPEAVYTARSRIAKPPGRCVRVVRFAPLDSYIPWRGR